MKSYWEDRYQTQGRKTVGFCGFTQDQFEKKTAEVLSRVEFLLRKVFAGKIVLDFGCGWGRFSKMLASFCSQVHGVDISEWAILEARSYAPECKFLVYDGVRIPYPDDYFEGVFCWTVLQHIEPARIDGSCEEIKRVCGEKAALLLYENVSTWHMDKSHVWFRSSETYGEKFNLGSSFKEMIKGSDGVNEDHILMVMEKT